MLDGFRLLVSGLSFWFRVSGVGIRVEVRTLENLNPGEPKPGRDRIVANYCCRD